MIRLNDLTIGYGHRILLQHASATIPAGELVALVGRNGTGKSTLLRAIAGLGERLGGEIRLDGHSLETLSPQQLATTVSFVTTERVRIPNLRCEDVVALGRAPYTNWIGRVQEQDKAIVERSLELVGMAAFAGKTMDRMSDGECQRVMIARALAQDTPIILLDEPTSSSTCRTVTNSARCCDGWHTTTASASSSRRTNWTSPFRSATRSP